MAKESKFAVWIENRLAGYLIKTAAHTRFLPREGVTSADVRLALLAKKVEIQDLSRPKRVRAASPVQPTKRPETKLTDEEWYALERKQTKYFPRSASLETRGSIGWPMAGGLPSLGKRR